AHPEDARAAIVAVIAETAAKVNRPVRVSATGPDGTWPLIVHPDGTVEADEDAEAPPQRRSRRRQVAPIDEPGPPAADPAPIDPPPQAPAAASAPAPWIRQGAPASSRRELRQSFLTSEQAEEPATSGLRGMLT